MATKKKPEREQDPVVEVKDGRVVVTVGRERVLLDRYEARKFARLVENSSYAV